MGERIVVSGGEALREFPLPQGTMSRSIALEGAGALCASQESLYAASRWGDVIWRIDARLLVPTGLFAGGPGICRLMLSRSGARLYALCGEADSLLVLDACSGVPLKLNRVGVGPCAMTMDESGAVVAVAGGESGEILLLEADTLSVVRRLQTSGMAFDTALCEGAVYALSLNDGMNTTLTAFFPSGAVRSLALEGMPGALEVIGGQIVAATHERISIIDREASHVLTSCDAAGRASRIWHSSMGLVMTDMWSESLFARGRATGYWRRLADNVIDAVILT